MRSAFSTFGKKTRETHCPIGIRMLYAAARLVLSFSAINQRATLSPISRLSTQYYKSANSLSEKSRLESRLKAVGAWNRLKAGLQTRRSHAQENSQTGSKT